MNDQTKQTHTPGPWRLDDKGYILPVEWTHTSCAVCEIVLSRYMNGNACLIAAAPELLDACKLAKKYLEKDLVEPGRTVFWKLVAAIAKAEAPQ